jgi:hypothetical protein
MYAKYTEVLFRTPNKKEDHKLNMTMSAAGQDSNTEHTGVEMRIKEQA